MLIAALVLSTGLHCTASAERWSLIAIVCADGDLAEPGQRYAQGLTEAAHSGGWSLALQLDNGNEHPTRRLFTRGAEVPVQAPTDAAAANSASPAALADAFRWAAEAAAADRYAVAIFGHGVSASGRGWNGARVAPWPALAVDASAGDDPLEPWELATAIVTGLGQRADVVVLDCCYGASLEVAWDLRGATDAILASPGRMLSSGIAWSAMLAHAPDAEDGPDLAGAWARAAGQPLTAVRTDRLPEVARSIGHLSAAAVRRIDQAAPFLTDARSRCPTWGSQAEMCDVRALSAVVAAGADAEIAAAARETVAAIDGCVVDRGGGGAVTAPFPAGIGGERPGVRPDGFTEISGWGEMTRAYRDRLRDLMRRTLNDRRHDDAAT